MNRVAHTTFYKFLYGFLFIIIIPGLLAYWAILTDPIIHLHSTISKSLGIILVSIGLILIIWGMLSLIIYGKGLPMNAFPPQRFVHQGIYRLIPHPIYLGFSFCCFGIAIIFQSASGLWLVSPIVTLGCVAIVEGFEKNDLPNRFGSNIRKSFIRLPPNEDRKPILQERLSVYLLVLIPWLVLYETFVSLGIPSDAIVGYFGFEHNLPILEWTELIYAGTYLIVLLAPLIATSAKILREFSIAGLLATGAMVLFFISIPVIAPPREFMPEGLFGRLLLSERNFDIAAAAFPSYHVIWAIISARLYEQSYPGKKLLWWSLAFLIAVSCITTGMHAIADVLAGVLMGLLFLKYKYIWGLILSLSEHIANSWKEWNFGPVRIIDHGIYGGLGAALGVLIVGILLGTEMLDFNLLIAFSSLIVAGLWAQLIEGSPRLLRPYGYYGGVIGVAFGALVVALLGGNALLLLGAYAVAAPVIQAFGRLRCLVQGCCHGREAPAYNGIRYIHSRSRVTRLTKYSGIPLYPTPVYSILWNIVIEIILLRLWILHIEPSMIAGLYLILNGLGRFVEEAYRGEPQTPILGKLRLYQLMAILSVLSGAILTTVRTYPNTYRFEINLPIIIAAVVFGLITWFALGVDFPNSNKRFARLV